MVNLSYFVIFFIKTGILTFICKYIDSHYVNFFIYFIINIKLPEDISLKTHNVTTTLVQNMSYASLSNKVSHRYNYFNIIFY